MAKNERTAYDNKHIEDDRQLWFQLRAWMVQLRDCWR